MAQIFRSVGVMNITRFGLLYGLLLVILSGCGATFIPNTQVEDTAENREVLEFVERYRHAMEARDMAEVMTLVSDRYLDHNGTIDPNDDRDFDQLREDLTRLADRLLDVRYEMFYRRISQRQNRILVDYTYTGRFKIATSDGERWTRRLEDNRLEIIVENGEFRITSGL